MLFGGIDLAWSSKNGSGISILKDSKGKVEFVKGTILFSNEEIINYIKENVRNKEAIITIDAPLIVPNEEGRRLAEVEVGKLFRKYDAGAHPANRKRLSEWTGDVRGETISNLLEREGFKHDPVIIKKEKSRKFFEVYPHPSMVVLFNLDKILRYKAKPKRDYNFRYKEFEKYRDNLKKLNLILPKDVLKQDLTELKAQKLKDYEDLLDSIFCAYLGYYAWLNPDNCAILGNMKEGYIHTPIFSSMKSQLNLKQNSLNEFTKN